MKRIVNPSPKKDDRIYHCSIPKSAKSVCKYPCAKGDEGDRFLKYRFDKSFSLKLIRLITLCNTVTNGKSKSVHLDNTAQMVVHNIFQGSFSEIHCVRKLQYLTQVGFEGNREIALFFLENDFL